MGKFSHIQIMWLISVLILIVTMVYPLGMLLYKGIFSKEGVEYTIKTLSTPEVWEYTFNTLKLSIAVTILSIFIGVPLAFLTTRTNISKKNLIKFLIIFPFILPPYICAISWIQLAAPYVGYLNKILDFFGFGGNLINIYSFEGLVFIMTIKFYTYVYLTVSSALERMDSSLEEAGRICGASIFKVAKDITLPLVFPSIMSGALLTFVATCSDFGIPALIGDRAHYHVLTTMIYSSLSIPDINKAISYSIILLVLASIVLLLQKKVFEKQNYATITGKVSKLSLISLGKYKPIIESLLFISLIFVSIVPIISLFISAFLKNLYCPIIDLSSYTLDNFKFVLFEDETTTTAIKTSLFSALISSTLVTLFGFILAYLIVKANVKGKYFLDLISTLPYALPGTVVGIAIILAFINTPIFNTIWILPLAYFIRYLFYGVKTISGSLVQIDKTLEEAAIICGVGRLKVLKDIIFPLIKPAIVSAWILTFMPTLRELTISIILYPPDYPTIGVAIYNLMEEGQYTAAYALSSIVVVIVVLAYILVEKISSRFLNNRLGD